MEKQFEWFERIGDTFLKELSERLLEFHDIDLEDLLDMEVYRYRVKTNSKHPSISLSTFDYGQEGNEEWIPVVEVCFDPHNQELYSSMGTKARIMFTDVDEMIHYFTHMIALDLEHDEEEEDINEIAQLQIYQELFNINNKEEEVENQIKWLTEQVLTSELKQDLPFKSTQRTHFQLGYDEQLKQYILNRTESLYTEAEIGETLLHKEGVIFPFKRDEAEQIIAMLKDIVAN